MRWSGVRDVCLIKLHHFSANMPRLPILGKPCFKKKKNKLMVTVLLSSRIHLTNDCGVYWNIRFHACWRHTYFVSPIIILCFILHECVYFMLWPHHSSSVSTPPPKLVSPSLAKPLRRNPSQPRKKAHAFIFVKSICCWPKFEVTGIFLGVNLVLKKKKKKTQTWPSWGL